MIPYKIRFGRSPDPNVITETSTTANMWSLAWTWRCPEGVQTVLNAGDAISAKLFAAAAEMTSPGALLKIEARNPQGRLITKIFGPANYVGLTEFTDTKARARLELVSPVIIAPKSLIQIFIWNPVAMTAADLGALSFGVLETNRA